MCATDEGKEKGEKWCKRAIWENTLPEVTLPRLSVTTKQAGCSSADQGGGKGAVSLLASSATQSRVPSHKIGEAESDLHRNANAFCTI